MDSGVNVPWTYSRTKSVETQKKEFIAILKININLWLKKKKVFTNTFSSDAQDFIFLNVCIFYDSDDSLFKNQQL